MVARAPKKLGKKNAAKKNPAKKAGKPAARLKKFSTAKSQLAGPLSLDIRKPRVLIVEARYYEDIADALFEGAKAAIEASDFEYDRIDVPGALEIPAAIRFAMNRTGSKAYDGYVALGCVIRGETTHYDIVTNESARGLQQLALDFQLAIGNGILTVENEDQAWDRARTDRQNKGGDAALACVAMIGLKQLFAL
ncbi:6,7-dimethyl-8-ribityllumazine synthase [Ferrovibrio sp.]|uniref:6,7-dimethyl-8-ribityllumazine synthase n=1 Tax=Ferrovibrio sp. TaxID=1917215 RepID=UPI00345D9B98|nr:6,7-dimethyl-8-ribityllumazine synthase [Ferrovibrio sp.]